MSKNDFLQRKYEEINKLKNMLQAYPDEYKDNIINSINNVSDEINTYLEKIKRKNKEKDTMKASRIAANRITLDELKLYDGIGGNLAYVAVEGTVYDVTPIKSWLNGKHYGLKAGQDLTEFFNTCHEKEKNILKCLRVVGTLKE